MGRIIKDLEINGIKRKAIFDTGSVQSFITEKALPEDAVCIPIESITARIGGLPHEIKKRCLIPSKLENINFEFDAFLIDNLGKAQEKGDVDIDIVIGAATMEEWGINLYPTEQKLDLHGLIKRQFLCF